MAAIDVVLNAMPNHRHTREGMNVRFYLLKRIGKLPNVLLRVSVLIFNAKARIHYCSILHHSNLHKPDIG